LALRVCRAYAVSDAPIEDAIADGIQFFAQSTHGDALPNLVGVSSFAPHAHAVADRNFIGGASAIGLTGGTGREIQCF
jgi:hypothetical protein